MKRSNALYYLLFILLITGAFASMAQNSYGTKIMGLVAFAFSLVFVFELVRVAQKPGKKDPYLLTELICLIALSLVFGLRIFYVHFPFIEWIFSASAIVLAIVFIRRLITRYREIHSQNKFVASLILAFHFSIILFLFSLALIPFFPLTGELTGFAGFILLLVYLLASLLKKDLLLSGQHVTGFSLVRTFSDHSILIVSLFVLFSLYTGLNRAGIIPGIYSDEYPKGYFELVNEATSKKEKPVNGRYRYEDYMEKYKEFIRKTRIKDK